MLIVQDQTPVRAILTRPAVTHIALRSWRVQLDPSLPQGNVASVEGGVRAYDLGLAVGVCF